MGQPEGQVQYYTREQVTGAGASVPVLSSVTDISFQSQDNSINSVSSNFLTTGYLAGMYIAVSGSQRNDRQFLIASVTATKLLVIDASVAPESAGNSITIGPATVLRANQGNVKDAPRFVRSYICTICNQSFPETKMQYFRGKWYCYPNGDYKDIASILKVEWARGYKPAGLGEERIIPPIIKG